MYLQHSLLSQYSAFCVFSHHIKHLEKFVVYFCGSSFCRVQSSINYLASFIASLPQSSVACPPAVWNNALLHMKYFSFGLYHVKLRIWFFFQENKTEYLWKANTNMSWAQLSAFYLSIWGNTCGNTFIIFIQLYILMLSTGYFDFRHLVISRTMW